MIGIMMLDTRFPRLAGDIGNPGSFSEPPCYRYVTGASVKEVVSDQPIDGQLLEKFLDTAIQLEDDGATVIGTSCGFLGSVQEDIESSLNIPFLSSSLILIPLLRRMFGAQTQIGVLTFDDSKLGAIHFGGELDQFIAIHGLSTDSNYRQVIAADNETLDPELAQQEVMNVAARCIDHRPETDLILIECTNLSPWKKQIKTRFGLPVFDLVDALEWVDKSAPTCQRPDIADGR
ncbi:MAG: hypothetical protein ACR2QW_11060 [bacterium]